jgi:hypothetical protein
MTEIGGLESLKGLASLSIGYLDVIALIQNRRDAPLLLQWGEGDLN